MFAPRSLPQLGRIMASAQIYPLRQRRFAPLNPERKGTSSAPPLKGIVFDVDGTLCLPQNHMFVKMRESLGILHKEIDILHHISSLPTPEQQLEAADKIKTIEREAMQSQEPQPGLVELMDYLHERGVKRALCTRNFETPVRHLLDNHLPAHVFLPIITRETPGLMPKPDPAGILHIAHEWGLDSRGENLIMVGDSIDDMTAGHTAGAATVLLLNDHNVHLKEHPHTDLCIERLDELIDILDGGFVGNRDGDKVPTSD
ncbi:putative HAD superfamily hydrolase [Aspergillus nomiae NRRL 13137]|uniref:Putative HAD superfamily hydrolase n=1 Tax=Aspergillus nomiae NRRL (strain ATCC 15546 / NRRL 13137 / CBS 260.88 / M93) TaxID=1509407 RepID=A0A0L1J1V8_ASPN3|nr:putative HAD superfamily hydrolase [Aspergillus nomiae NRRL 13137]KNG85398.1 putative HAD superfamily hydrolase [Aspergillus nomiae NRRL 13137]